MQPATCYIEHDVVLRSGTSATAVDTSTHAVLLAVLLSDGQRLGYDALLLATGSTPRLDPSAKWR